MNKRTIHKIKLGVKIFFLLSSLFSFVYIACSSSNESEDPSYLSAIKKYTKKWNLVVKDIHVTGTKNAHIDQIIQASGIHLGDGVLNLKLDFIRLKVSKLQWVDQVVVHRNLTGTISINIQEYKPFCLWLNKGQWFLVNDCDQIIDSSPNLSLYPNLPRIQGAHAPHKLRDFYSTLYDFPSIRDRVKVAEFISQRRWNIILDNDVCIMLPEDHPQKALHRLLKVLGERPNVLEIVEKIDLRIPGRVILQKKAQSGK